MTENTDLFLEERRRAILDRIKEAGRISVNELSKAFGVSPVTIRTDLNILAEENLITRTHGGAVPFTTLPREISLAYRMQRQTVEKEQIGKKAAELIQNGDSIFVDSSSTALTIVKHLRDRTGLTLITNGIAAASELTDTRDINIVMPGGQFRHEMASLVGIDGLEILKTYNISKGFFGAYGISLEAGLTDISPEEARIKKAIVDMCGEVICVLDATKWKKTGAASFASIEQIDQVITCARQEQASSSFITEIKNKGVKITLLTI